MNDAKKSAALRPDLPEEDRYDLSWARLIPPRPDGTEFIRPEEYNPDTDRGHLACSGDGCETPLVFVRDSKKDGDSRDIPAHFRRAAGALHADTCQVLQSCAQKAGHQKFDPTIGVRFHINDGINRSEKPTEDQIREFEKKILPKKDPLYRKREIVQIHGAQDFADAFETIPHARLKDSVVRYRTSIAPLSEFFAAGPDRLTRLFNSLAAQKGGIDRLPRLFYINPRHWGSKPQNNGSYPLLCHPCRANGLALEPRITFGTYDLAPGFNYEALFKNDAKGAPLPILVLAVPRLWSPGDNKGNSKQVLYLDITNPAMIHSHALDLRKPSPTPLPL